MANFARSFNRQLNELRPITLEVGVNRYAEGSCLASFGHTKVLCTATVERNVPPFLKGKGQGWLTAEYSLLPRSTDVRVKRERDKVGGRTAEIQRLIGRGLRAAINFRLTGEQTIILDCDVLQADGGTRTASITGAYVALAIAIGRLRKSGELQADPLIDAVAAVSVGICNGQHVLDLDYKEDSTSEVDMNIVMTGDGKFVEVQGTAESKAFSSEDLTKLTDLASKGITKLLDFQRTAIQQGLKMV